MKVSAPNSVQYPVLTVAWLCNQDNNKCAQFLASTTKVFKRAHSHYRIFHMIYSNMIVCFVNYESFGSFNKK